MRVLIIGCGYVGQALGAELTQRGHAVWGLQLSSGGHPAGPESKGMHFITADVTNPASLPAWGSGYDWVVYCVSAKGGGVARYEEVYFQGMRNVLVWVSQAPPAKLLYTSSTSVYGQSDGSWVLESSPTAPSSPTGQILIETEKLLLHSAQQIGSSAVILRLAGIYGPGRSYWIDQMRSGFAEGDTASDQYINMIHREDVIGALLASLVHGGPGKIYNAVDDEPVTMAAIMKWLSKRLLLPSSSSFSNERTRATKRTPTNKRVSNDKLKTELGYRFKFPTFREGFSSLLGG